MLEGYRKLKEQAQQREEWRRQAFEPEPEEDADLAASD